MGSATRARRERSGRARLLFARAVAETSVRAARNINRARPRSFVAKAARGRAARAKRERGERRRERVVVVARRQASERKEASGRENERARARLGIIAASTAAAAVSDGCGFLCYILASSSLSLPALLENGEEERGGGRGRGYPGSPLSLRSHLSISPGEKLPGGGAAVLPLLPVLAAENTRARATLLFAG